MALRESRAEFAGRVALVSGGLGDIGLAIAERFARGGADVAVCDRSADASRLTAVTQGLGVRVRADRVDVADAAAVEAWIAEVAGAWGVPTIVVPCAAVVVPQTFEALELSAWRAQLQINLDGALHMALPAARGMRAANVPGRIMFVGSWAAHQVHPHIPAYSVSKAALRMLMRCMAAEYAPHGILVNEVAPGFVNAGMGRPDQDELDALERRVPVKSLSTAQDIAREVVHLCSHENRHITGATILVDGGLSLFGVSPDS